MSVESVSFSLPSGVNNRWIKFNANMTGVYRVHYDDDNWRALVTQLKQDHSVSNLILHSKFVSTVLFVSLSADVIVWPLLGRSSFSELIITIIIHTFLSCHKVATSEAVAAQVRSCHYCLLL